MSNNFDLNSLLKKGTVEIGRPDESAEELAARLRIEGRKAAIEDFKGAALFVTLLVGIVAVALLCVYLIVFDQTASAESKRWAQTVLTGIVTGAVSFLVGRALPKS